MSYLVVVNLFLFLRSTGTDVTRLLYACLSPNYVVYIVKIFFVRWVIRMKKVPGIQWIEAKPVHRGILQDTYVHLWRSTGWNNHTQDT